jgi:hypothetical protein
LFRVVVKPSVFISNTAMLGVFCVVVLKVILSLVMCRIVILSAVL